MQSGVEDSEHYNLLLEIHSLLKEIRKDFRIRTAKDKTRRRKKAAKDAALTQENTVKQAQEKQAHSLDRNPQGKPSKRQITETFEQPSTNKSLNQKAIEAPNKSNKQKSVKAKSKVSRRKIKRMLV
ncbi:MAG: hypothetical protein GX762_01615 [Bacteroidales bacterium]|nr:hypothetical protein [Bacteroidales bacterium]